MMKYQTLARPSLWRSVLCVRRFHEPARLQPIGTSKTPLEEYDRQVSIGRLRDDPYQREIISSLSDLHKALQSYHPPTPPKPKIEDLKPATGIRKLMSMFHGKHNVNNDVKVPLGIYLYGDVGCGKTMLMDLFYDTIPSHLPKKRIHFHQFMQHLHKRSHQLITEHGAEDLDTIPLLASEIAQDSTILCFDEFQVTDVADAMLLRRLLMLMLRKDHGLVLFTTSNRAPDDLYINGIQRESFIPCIKLIKKQTKVVYLNSPTDYRKIPKPVSSVYFYPKPGIDYHSPTCQAAAAKHVEQWYTFFSQGQGPVTGVELTIWGRKLKVPIASPPNVAQFTFQDLCGKPLAAGDYLSLANSFTSFIITDIPYLSIDQRDEVRRFITFLDAVYDAHGRLAVTAHASFNDLFVEPEELTKNYSAATTAKVLDNFENDDLVKKHGFDKKIALKTAGFFAIDEERFAFARALSRLTQMSTQEWVDNARKP